MSQICLITLFAKISEFTVVNIMINVCRAQLLSWKSVRLGVEGLLHEVKLAPADESVFCP